MGISEKQSPVLWIGRQLAPESDNNSRLKLNSIKCYKTCICGPLTISCGDFVLVSNADAKDPDFMDGCDVAQIKMLYELEDQYSKLISEPYRAVVQWYSWPQAIPEKHFDSDDICIDFEREVIEEHRPYDNDISIETIQNKCLVIKGDVADSVENLLKRSSTRFPTFICRYKFAKTKYFKLQPIIEKSLCNSAARTPMSSSRRSSSKKEEKRKSLLNESGAVRRNLSYAYDSDGNSTAASDILNYSIVNMNEAEPNGEEKIKIKLRVSQKFISNTKNEEPIKENLVNYSKFGTELETDPLSLDSPKKTSLENTPKAKKISSTRRRSILKTPGDVNMTTGTPKRNIQLSNIVEERFYYRAETSTPSRSKAKSPSSKNLDENYEVTPSKRKKMVKIGSLTPTISHREKSNSRRKSELEIIRENLHVSAVPDCLPCREKEYENIYNFIEHKISSDSGGCMYISGVPGTGKTATVTRVVKALKLKSEAGEIPNFEFIDINGMKLTEPRQAYVQIYKQLNGKSLSWEHAHSLLEKRFTTAAPRRTTTVLLVDELDVLCNRRQDVVYNLLDWPSKPTAKLVVITIANTMDLPERLLLGKVTSRLGLTRLTFQPYTHKQLQEIVTSRLIGSQTFKSDAVQLVARKVAAVSGDARRALDICRRATEIAEEIENGKNLLVNMIHVQKALEEMISSAKVQAIKSCSKQEKIFLQAISSEVTRTGLEEVVFNGVYTQIESFAAFLGSRTPSISQAFKICSKLGSQRLIICEHSRNDIYQKIILNVSSDDIHFALQNNFD